MLINELPRYHNPCSECIFVGQYGQADGYICGKDPFVMLRYSGEESDYSGFSAAVLGEHLPGEYAKVLQDYQDMKQLVERRNFTDVH